MVNRYYLLGFMKVSHIFICFFLISLLSLPVSADLIIESTAIANITDKDAFSPALSPDGTVIAYVVYNNTSRNQQIFTIKIDGTDKRQLANDPYRKWGVEWLTDEISFIAYDNDGIEKISIVSLDGSGRRKLLNETIRQGREPIKRDRFWGGGSWNPERKVILFTSLGKMGDEKIFQVNIDGTGLKSVINDSSRQWNPQWSPDGNSFVYISQSDKNLDELFIANIDGTGKRQITNDGFKKFDLSWGTEGILFVSTESELASSEKIFIINPDGTGKKRLIEDGFNQKNPRWSWDGSKILYEDIDIKGNKLIKVLNLRKAIIEPTPTVKSTTVPIYTETPVVKETAPGKLTDYVSSLVLVVGIIVIVILTILSFYKISKKK